MIKVISVGEKYMHICIIISPLLAVFLFMHIILLSFTALILIGVLTLTIASFYVYHIQPDDKLCLQSPCLSLQEIIGMYVLQV